MDFLASVAIASAVAIVSFTAVCVVLAWRQGFADERPVLIENLLRRQGERVACHALASGGRDFAVAVKRCVECPQVGRCTTWLASGAIDGFESFCPNAGFIQRTKRLSA
ncbi:MAG TPA: DUF6455 family protein [Burkholderiales bacterium]|nr:DUF6455 family protein [Burkholderiales bacterium]